MNVTVKTIIDKLEDYAPRHLSEDWDPIGLIFGRFDKPVKTVMVALDLDTDTLQEAIDHNVDLVITHHPPIFQKLQTLNEEDPRRYEYIQMIQHDIALYAAHTNLDATTGGINDWLADAIGMSKERDIVDVTYTEKMYKVAFYVPKTAKDSVIDHVIEHLEELNGYSDVYFESIGIGHFKPSESVNPTIGQVGQETSVEEVKIECLVSEANLSTVIEQIKAHHPYEVPVYDVYSLDQPGKQYGYGRIGEVGCTTVELARLIHQHFPIDGIRFGAHDKKRQHERVAIFGGAGSSQFKKAKAKGATLYITGDISYHGAQDMMREGLDFIDMGHYTEHIMVSRVSELLEEWRSSEEWPITIIASQKQTDMFEYIKEK